MSLETKKTTEIVSINFVGAAGSDVGKQRENNEDTFVFDAEHGFFMVVDGMGGHEKGEVAARIAAEIIQTGIRKIENSPEIRLRDSIVLANNTIYQRALDESSNMGCVLTALLIENKQAVCGHIGDTRLYKIRHGEILKLTEDHSIIGTLEAEGSLSEKRLLDHPRRNEVTRCVGIEEKSFEDENFADIFQADFESDAAFLMCSDGLSDLLTTAQILEIIENNADDPHRIVENSIDKANDFGGKDNITVIFIAGKNFAAETLLRQNTPQISIKQKVISLFSGRSFFLLYGAIIGAIIVLAIFSYLYLYTGEPEIPVP